MADIESRTAADASLVGTHCQYGPCNQLDFLPFRCPSCHHTFCLDHRTESAHACTRPGAWGVRRREANLVRPSIGANTPTLSSTAFGSRPLGTSPGPRHCPAPSCRAFVGTSLAPAVHCQGCRRDYCLKHRLREDHDCDAVARAAAAAAQESAAAQDRAAAALKRLRLWGRETAAKVLSTGATASQGLTAGFSSRSDRRAGASSSGNGSRAQRSATQRAAALNQLKKAATGDAKVPAEKRIYLYVEAEAATAQAKIPRGEFFYSRDWVVGRLLDAAARSLQVENVNNQSTEEKDKLRVFHVELGRVLEFNEKVGDVAQNGHTIVLLRGIGPAVPNLIDL